MADSAAFDFACEQLEAQSSFDRLEARGTIRLALKEAGLEARNVSPDQMKVVVQRVLPKELEQRGIDGCESICSDLARGLDGLAAPQPKVDSPDAVFARLGG